MATRSLTDTYRSYRSSGLRNFQKKPLFKQKKPRKGQSDDTVALVSDEDFDHVIPSSDDLCDLPPEWTIAVETVQYEISKIKKRMKDLGGLHSKHLNRPTLDDSLNDEHTIDVTTQEITQLFHQCQRCIQNVQSGSIGSNAKAEKTMVRNVVSSLASQLQDLSQEFKRGQSNYLKRMKYREDVGSTYLGTDYQSDKELSQNDNLYDLYDKGFTTAQLQMVEQNDQVVRLREEEISQVIRSIGDLNVIFKDLSGMVIDQGTILDRIDYNVEQASVEVEKGLEQLQKGEKHQKSSRKMLIILILAAVSMVLLIALVITKS